MRIFNRPVSAKSVAIFGIDAVVISSVILATVPLSSGHAASGLWAIALMAVLCELCFYYNDLYDLTVVHSTRELVIRVLQASGAAAIVLAVAHVTAPSLSLDASSAIFALALIVATVVVWRTVFAAFAPYSRLERLLILGTGPTAQMLARRIVTQMDFAYRLVGFVDDGASRRCVRAHDIVGSVDDIERIVLDWRIDRIVVGISDRRGHLPFTALLHAKLSGVCVEDATTTYERLTGKILIDDLKPSWLIFSDGFRVTRPTRAIKRLLDLAMALAIGIVTAPLMLLTAIAIALDSRGPVLYSQERVGEHGRVFTLHKFRSMRVDAEQAGRPIWAKDHDDRITRVGRFIRKARLDELPQLWNVIRGDMAFVGPRPERPFFVEQLAAEIPFYMERHVVKPGITGWAQVKYHYGSSIEDAMEKLRYDLYYIKHLSVVFDLTIAVDTVKVILFGRGAK